MNKLTFPELVVEIRTTLGIKQWELAKLLDLHQTTISKWELGQHPTKANLATLRRFLENRIGMEKYIDALNIIKQAA